MLPLVLTKYNLPVAKLTSFDKFIDRSVDKNIDTPIVPKPPVEKEEKTPIKKNLQKKLEKTKVLEKRFKMSDLWTKKYGKKK